MLSIAFSESPVIGIFSIAYLLCFLIGLSNMVVVCKKVSFIQRVSNLLIFRLEYLKIRK